MLRLTLAGQSDGWLSSNYLAIVVERALRAFCCGFSPRQIWALTFSVKMHQTAKTVKPAKNKNLREGVVGGMLFVIWRRLNFLEKMI